MGLFCSGSEIGMEFGHLIYGLAGMLSSAEVAHSALSQAEEKGREHLPSLSRGLP